MGGDFIRCVFEKDACISSMNDSFDRDLKCNEYLIGRRDVKSNIDRVCY